MLVIAFLILIVLSCSLYVGDCISCPDCLVLFYQHRQRKTRQVGQEIQSPTQAEQDRAIRTRNTITNIDRIRQDNQDKKYNYQHRQNKTGQSGQEIQ
jgi:hypothetical protein